MLTIENLSFSYKHHNVLQSINIALPEQSVTCLIGPNGSGKTTLLDCIMGIHSSYQGNIHFRGTNVETMKPNVRMRHMSYVPQGKGQSFPFTVKEMVVMGRAPYLGAFEQPSEGDEILAQKALDDLGMGDYSEKVFTKLSGGEQQQVILARALTQDTELLIFDEPMVSLDYYNELQFLEILAKLVKEYGKSIVMATHAPNHAFFFQEKGIRTNVLMLKAGEAIGFGPPVHMLTHDNLKRVFDIQSTIVCYDHFKKYIIPKRMGGL